MVGESIVSILIEDHNRMETALKAFPGIDVSVRGEAFAELADMIVRQQVAEEIAVFPVFRDQPGGAAIASARLAEQESTLELMTEMEQMQSDSDGFERAFEALRTVVLRHDDAEDQEVIPRLLDGEDYNGLVDTGRFYSAVRSALPEAAYESVSELSYWLHRVAGAPRVFSGI